MLKIRTAVLRRRVRFACLAALLFASAVLSVASAQTAPENQYYSRVNTFGFFAAYSNDSSQMLLGTADKRKLLDFGAIYERRIYMNHIVNWQYNAELLPVALESDPLGYITQKQVTPTPESFTYSAGALLTCTPHTVPYSVKDQNGTVYSGTQTYFCRGRDWNIGEAMSPVGFQWNFRPRHTLQPFLIGHGGYMYSTHPIPVQEAGSFNFTFDIGAGIELYRTAHQSIRAEYRYHHISNDWTAYANPGIDNGLFQVTYAFGR